MMKKILSYSRVAIPLMLGICIGIALSFMILPLLEESSCEWRNYEVNGNNQKSHAQSNHFMKGLDLDSFRSSEFEPKVVKSEQSGAQSAQKPVRYRFIKSEVHMKDVLLLSYTTSIDQITRRAAALNKTIDDINMQFFADAKYIISNDLPLVRFNLIDPSRLTLVTLKYLASQNSKQPQFKYYAIFPDSTYVKLNELKNMVLSLNDEQYLGFATDFISKRCDLSAGFILSQGALNVVGQNIAQCERTFNNDDSIGSVDRCISNSIKEACSTTPSSLNVQLQSLRYENGMSLKDGRFKLSLAVSDIATPTTIYSIRRVLAKGEMQATVTRIEEIRQQISGLYATGSLNSDVPSWAPLTSNVVHTTNRYDILRWTLIDDNQTFLEYDYDGAQTLKDTAMRSHNDMIKVALDFINGNGDRYELEDVVHAYSRSDPNRGYDYHLTLLLKDKVQKVVVTKVFEMIKPRTNFQVQNVQFNPPSTPLYILVPFIGDDHDELKNLMSLFSQVLKNEPHIHLNIVLGHSLKRFDAQLSNTDPFQPTKDCIEEFKKKTGVHNSINWISPRVNHVEMIDLISNAVNSLPDDVIVLTSTISTVINTAFIHRVRMNTWKHRQIYAPIAFWEYLPELIYENKPRPSRINVSRAIGHFGEKWYDHIAFFSNDYKMGLSSGKNGFNEPVDVLMSLSGMEMLRAVDPDLLVRSYTPTCTARAYNDKPKCSLQWLDNIGSGPILAKKLLQEGKIIGKTYD